MFLVAFNRNFTPQSYLQTKIIFFVQFTFFLFLLFCKVIIPCKTCPKVSMRDLKVLESNVIPFQKRDVISFEGVLFEINCFHTRSVTEEKHIRPRIYVLGRKSPYTGVRGPTRPVRGQCKTNMKIPCYYLFMNQLTLYCSCKCTMVEFNQKILVRYSCLLPLLLRCVVRFLSTKNQST